MALAKGCSLLKNPQEVIPLLQTTFNKIVDGVWAGAGPSQFLDVEEVMALRNEVHMLNAGCRSDTNPRAPKELYCWFQRFCTSLINDKVLPGFQGLTDAQLLETILDRHSKYKCVMDFIMAARWLDPLQRAPDSYIRQNKLMPLEDVGNKAFRDQVFTKHADQAKSAAVELMVKGSFQGTVNQADTALLPGIQEVFVQMGYTEDSAVNWQEECEKLGEARQPAPAAAAAS